MAKDFEVKRFVFEVRKENRVYGKGNALLNERELSLKSVTSM